MDLTMQPQQLDQAATQARQYYEQMAQQTQPPAAPIAPPATQFYPQFPAQVQTPQPSTAPPQMQQQIGLLMQSNEQVLAMLGGISQAINTQATQTTNHGLWIDHLLKRIDATDRRLDRVAAVAIIGMATVATISLAANFWPKTTKTAIVPTASIVRAS
jgi:hypothetical protein